MFEELDVIVLNKRIEKYNLKKGDLGTIVHIHEKDRAFEVEFVTAQGKTLAVLTLTSSDIRPIERNEILHVRPFATPFNLA